MDDPRLAPSDPEVPLGVYASLVIAGAADLAAAIEAVDDDQVRESLREVAIPLLWDLVMLSKGTARLLQAH